MIIEIYLDTCTSYNCSHTINQLDMWYKLFVVNTALHAKFNLWYGTDFIVDQFRCLG